MTIVVDAFPQRSAYRVSGLPGRVVPCPAEVGERTCVECRLCLDRDLTALGVAIGFALHGWDAGAARQKLVPLRVVRA